MSDPLVIRRGSSPAPVVLDVTPDGTVAVVAPVAEDPVVVEPGVHALDAWAIGTDGEGNITVHGQPMAPEAARALWTRLGVVLGQVERDVNAAAWEALRASLDAEYRWAMPVRVRVQRPGKDGQRAQTRDVGGMVYGCNDRTVAVRLGVFEVAVLHPREHKDGSTWWEGGASTLWPGSLNQPQSRPNGHRVRLADEAAQAAPKVDPDLGRVVPPQARRQLVDLSAPVGRGRPALPPRRLTSPE